MKVLQLNPCPLFVVYISLRKITNFSSGSYIIVTPVLPSHRSFKKISEIMHVKVLCKLKNQANLSFLKL